MARDDDRVQAPKYVLRMETEARGTLVGRPGQQIPELVGEVYGQPNGFLPWDCQEWVGLIVTVPEQRIHYDDLTDASKPTRITTSQRVIDHVHSWVQEPVK